MGNVPLGMEVNHKLSEQAMEWTNSNAKLCAKMTSTVLPTTMMKFHRDVKVTVALLVKEVAEALT